MQRASRPSRPKLAGATSSSLTLGAQGKCEATVEPNTPAGLTATAVSTSQINLAWTADSTPAPNAATYYVVERSPDGLGSWATVGTSVVNSFSDVGLPASTQFYYRVSAINCYGGSLASATANATTQSTIPAAPTGVSASASTTAVAVTITWTDASTNETGFYVYRNTSNTTTGATQVNSVAAGVQTYTDNAANSGGNAPAEGTTYYYWVSAYSGGGESSKTAASQNATGGVTTAIVAEWVLDFSSGTPSGYVLTRASSGTYVNSSGYIASQASGSSGNSAARLTHDSSGTRLGLLVEESRTNVARYSQTFTDASWSRTLSSVNNNGGAFWTSPENQAEAVLLEQVSGSNEHNIRRTITVANPTWSLFVKKQNLTTGTGRAGRYITLVIRDAASGSEYVHATFDLDQGTMTQSATVGTNYTDRQTGIEAYKDSWYRIHVRATRASASLTFTAALATTGTPTMGSFGQNYNAANSTDGVYIWGAQVEAVNSPPTAYIETPANSDVTRSADLAHVLDSSITSWGDPGALVIHFYPPGQAGTLISTDDAATAQVGIEASSTTAARAFWSSGSTSTGTIGTGVQKAVHYWNGSTSKFCINGGTVQSGTNNLTIGNTDFVTLGAEATDSSGVPGTFSQYANCIVRYVAFYSGTLTDANLQTITT